MQLKTNSKDSLAYTLLLSSMLVGLLLWTHLPEQIAIHFTTNGTPNTIVSKPIGITAAPLIGIITILIIRNTPNSLKTNPNSPKPETIAVLFTSAIIAYAQSFIYAWNINPQLNTNYLTIPVLITTFALVLYIHQKHTNYSLGSK